MRILIVEDDFTSRRLLQKILAPYGECDIAVDGKEALEAFTLAVREGRRYRLICLDIMMPEIDGQQVLKKIRQMEKELGIAPREEATIIMTTALDAPRDVVEAYYRGGCTDYLVKPIGKVKLLDLLRKYALAD